MNAFQWTSQGYYNINSVQGPVTGSQKINAIVNKTPQHAIQKYHEAFNIILPQRAIPKLHEGMRKTLPKSKEGKEFKYRY